MPPLAELSRTPEISKSARERSSAPGWHLSYLDGLRGLAALYVMLFHILQFASVIPSDGKLSPWFSVMRVFKLGHYAVGVFIVLSGYCLMLPVVKADGGSFPGGLSQFFKRRARRILPPYYAALVLSALLLWLVPVLQRDNSRLYGIYPSTSAPLAFLSHLLLIHNLRQDWIYKFDGPLWSVATEWQIYFLFPLLLLPLMRRFGIVVPIVVGCTLGVVTISLGLGYACVWYTGLFAMGMAGAVLSSSANPLQHLLGKSSVAAVLLLSALTVICAMFESRWHVSNDILIGAATAAFLVHCTRHLHAGKQGGASLAVRILSSRGLIALGGFSCSLYLIHKPLVQLLQISLAPLHLDPAADFLFGRGWECRAVSTAPISFILPSSARS